MVYEKKKYKEIELRCDEVQDVMSEVPPWILRQGITTLFIIVIILLVGSWFFKYPDSITAEITVTSADPPASIIARSTGKIDEIFVQNNQEVKAGTLLGVIQNQSKTRDMLRLINMMNAWEKSGYSEDAGKEFITEGALQLGSIQSMYASFLSSLNDYLSYVALDYYSQKIAVQKHQLMVQREYHDNIIKQVPIAIEQLRTSKSIYERDSILNAQRMISDHEFEITKGGFLQSRQTYLAFKSSLNLSELQLIKGDDILLDLQQQSSELGRKHLLTLRNATELLNAQIKLWEQEYLFVSPIDGFVTQMGIWSQNQNVTIGEHVFTVVPLEQTVPRGKAMLPTQGAGKVKIGQRVNVRINNYPDQEFGYLLGKVESISSVPTTEGFYVVEVSFPNGMQTNYGKTLPIVQQIFGHADIITEDLRLLERFIMPIRKLLRSSR